MDTKTSSTRHIPVHRTGDAMRDGECVIGMHKDLTSEQNRDQALVEEVRQQLLDQLDVALDLRYDDYRVRTTHFNEFIFERDGKIVCRHEIEALIVHRPVEDRARQVT